MKKYILTSFLFISLQFAAFAQDSSPDLITDANIALISNTITEKAEITGTISSYGGWNVFVDDAIVPFEKEPLQAFSNSNLSELIKIGFQFASAGESNEVCYKYKIKNAVDGTAEMKFFKCSFN